MMRSAIGLATALLLVLASNAALARGGGHTGGGHMGGGHWGGGHWGGHIAHPVGFHNVHRFAAFHGARFHHRRPFFVGYGAYAAYGGCWQWRPTYWGWRRVWACGYPYYGYF